MKRYKNLILLFFDIILINLSYVIAIYIRFDGDIASSHFLQHLETFKENYLYFTVIKLFFFLIFRLYRSAWKYASIAELFDIALASVVGNIAVLAFMYMGGQSLPRSVYLIATLLDMLLIGGLRISARIILKLRRDYFIRKAFKKTMIIGAGDAGAMVIREFKNHGDRSRRAVALIDDDPRKLGQMINGIRVVGNRDDIVRMVEKLKIDQIIIAMPSAKKKDIGDIVKIANTTPAQLKILPGIYEIIDGKVDIKQIRDVEIEDLLGREEIKLDLKNISSYITGKRVMVTGGGGSIGSELCRQIANYSPSKLTILDIYENSAYDIQNELLRSHESLNLRTLIGSIRDRKRIEGIISEEKPEVIFHAAAHKHVPLMEASPKEAIKNNVFGTLNLAQLADKYGVKRFVMISTDKAVNPTNIMGASKRLCEMIVQSIDKHSETEFVAVRFGNVLGSNGSVIPLFKRQIAQGGPVTVTHPDIIRYFMTIPEAVQLVLQAGAMAQGGEIFVLDMGEPVKIVDLAEELIRLSGFEPGTDIGISFTGLRPGEKLFEELLMAEEGVCETSHEKIFIGKPVHIDHHELLDKLKGVGDMIQDSTGEELKDYIRDLLPSYRDEDID